MKFTRIYTRIYSSILVASVLALSGCGAVSGGISVSEPRVSDSASSASDGMTECAQWLASRLSFDTGEKFIPTDLGAESGKQTIILALDSDAGKYDIDLSGFSDEGYTIRTEGDTTVIAAKTESGLDRAVRRYARERAKDPFVSLTVGEGYKVGSIVLSGADISEYVILLPEAAEGNTAFSAGATENMKFAADELASYIEKTCGAKIGIQSVRGLDVMTDEEIRSGWGGHAVVILSDPTAVGNSGLEAGDMGCEDFRITVNCGIMRILGGNQRGCMYGVYDFLEKYIGWRFLPGGGGDKYSSESVPVEYLYENEKIVIDDMDYAESPDYKYRSCSYRGVYTETGFAKLRHNACENWYYAQSPKYGYGLGTTFYHEHSFEYQIEGMSPYEQPCFSDPAVLEEVTGSMCKLLDERLSPEIGGRIGYDINQISCSMNDNTNFCMCGECLNTISETSFSDLYIRFVNAAADVIAERYPGVMVYTIAYLWASAAPKVTVPRDNVIIHYCIQACNAHEFQSDDCAAYPKTSLGCENITERANIEGWADAADHLYIWYCSPALFSNIVPSPNIYEMYNEMRYFATLGAEGFYVEGLSNTQYNFENLKAYLFLKLMWDSDITREEFFGLIEEYMTIVYGEAGAPFLLEYIDVYQAAGDHVEGCFTNNYSYPFDMLDISFVRSNSEYMRYLFERAVYFAPDKETEAKIEIASVSEIFIGLSATYDSDYIHADDKSRAEYMSRWRKLVDIIKKYDMTGNSSVEEFPDGYELEMNPMLSVIHIGQLSREGRA